MARARSSTSFKKELAKAKRAQAQRRRKNLSTLPKYSASTFGNASINLSARWIWGGANSGGAFRGQYARSEGYVSYRNAWGQFMELPEQARAALYQLSVETAAKIKADAPKGKATQNRIPSVRNNPPGRLKRAIGSSKTSEGGAVVIDDERAPHWQYVMNGTPPHIITGPNGVTFWGWQNYHNKKKKGPVKVPYVNHPGSAPNDFITKHYHWARNEAFNRVLAAERAASRVVPSAGKKPL